MNDHGLHENCHLKLVITGKAACLTGEFTVHSHQFDIGITTGNKN